MSVQPRIRSVLGDLDAEAIPAGKVYAHEHLIIDSPLVADRFPHIHLHDIEAGVLEVDACAAAGVVLMVDAMPASDGRDVVRLAEIARRTGVAIVAATGLHHDRYYGASHWSNRVGSTELSELFVADLTEGIDEFDYTGPIVRRTASRAGLLKVATDGPELSDRDRRNLAAVAIAHHATGAPIMTHCEGGRGALEQVVALQDLGVTPGALLLSHVDKVSDLGYLTEVAATGATLELDQATKNRELGAESPTVRVILELASRGFGAQLVVGTDGARRTLWRSLGGDPGLDWLARSLPGLLRQNGADQALLDAVLRENALRALAWVCR